jgi:hypothetical protein
MNRCDWADCMEVGILDGVDTSLLNNEARKNIFLDESRCRFIYLCPKHWELGIGQLTSDND